MKKLEKKIYQDLEKDGYLTPYMFPMIGKDYGKTGQKKILVLMGYVYEDKYVSELFSPYMDSWEKKDKNNKKSDFIRHAWVNQKIDTKLTPQKWFEKNNSGLTERDVIIASFSRCPSKKKYQSNQKNILQVLGALQNDLRAPCLKAYFAADKSLQCIMDIAQPDELWLVGLSVQELIGSWGNSVKNAYWEDFRKDIKERFGCEIKVFSLRKTRGPKKEGQSYLDDCRDICKMLRETLPLNTKEDCENYKALCSLQDLLKKLPQILSFFSEPLKRKNAKDVLKKFESFNNKMTRKRQEKSKHNHS